MRTVDCFGLSCPIPLVNTKKALKDSPEGLDVLVDNVASRENVSRFGQASGYAVTVGEIEDGWVVQIRKQ